MWFCLWESCNELLETRKISFLPPPFITCHPWYSFNSYSTHTPYFPSSSSLTSLPPTSSNGIYASIQLFLSWEKMEMEPRLNFRTWWPPHQTKRKLHILGFCVFSSICNSVWVDIEVFYCITHLLKSGADVQIWNSSVGKAIKEKCEVVIKA